MVSEEIAEDGTHIPVDSLEQTIVYDGNFVLTITLSYLGRTYRQFYTNDGSNITNISQWKMIS